MLFWYKCNREIMDTEKYVLVNEETMKDFENVNYIDGSAEEMSNCLKLLQKKGYTNVYFVKNSYEFTGDRDLYYSLQHVKVVVHAVKQKGNIWETEINESDVYDFTEVRSWSSFAGIANNVGYYLQKSGELKPYKVNIKYNDVHSSRFNIV